MINIIKSFNVNVQMPGVILHVSSVILNPNVQQVYMSYNDYIHKENSFVNILSWSLKREGITENKNKLGLRCAKLRPA